MRSRITKSVLTEMATIRGAQRTAAEARAARASQMLRLKEALHEENEQKRLDSESRWNRIVSTPPMDAGMLQLCAADALRQQSAVARAETEVAQAAKNLDRNIAEWSASAKRQDVIEDLLHQANKAAANRRDDISMQDALDRHVWLGSSC
jgi:hypothetical protein